MGADPNVFDDDGHVHRQVRRQLLDTLTKFLAHSYSSPETWTNAYLTEWSTQPGKLEILVSIDWDRFYAHQDEETGQMSHHALANILDYLLRNNLWPNTANTRLGTDTYEVTYTIRTSDLPYPAYDLNSARWSGSLR